MVLMRMIELLKLPLSTNVTYVMKSSRLNHEQVCRAGHVHTHTVASVEIENLQLRSARSRTNTRTGYVPRWARTTWRSCNARATTGPGQLRTYTSGVHTAARVSEIREACRDTLKTWR